MSDCNWDIAKLRQQVVEAIQSNDVERLQAEEDALARLLRPHRALLYGDTCNKSLQIGKVAGFHLILQALREDEPSAADLKTVQSLSYAADFLLALRNRGALRVKDILPNQLETVMDVGYNLERAGLVRSGGRSSKSATYWLTQRGSLVAKHLEEEAEKGVIKSDSD